MHPVVGAIISDSVRVSYDFLSDCVLLLRKYKSRLLSSTMILFSMSLAAVDSGILSKSLSCRQKNRSLSISEMKIVSALNI